MNGEEHVQQTSEEYMRELREDHGRFSRILSLIGRDARLLVDEPDTVLPLFAEAIDYVVNFQNVYHHPREEIMFAKVAEKSKRLSEAAAALSREHNGTAQAGEELLTLLESVSSDSSHRADRTQLSQKLEGFARSMRKHISKEEELLYSQAWAELSAEDWDTLMESVTAIDPLEDDEESRYPLLAEYVSEGRTHNNVSIDGGPWGELLESGMKQADQLKLIGRTMRQQHREACALTLKSMRAMPVIPMLQPEVSIRVTSESAVEFGRAYMRWLREWGDVLRGEKEEL